MKPTTLLTIATLLVAFSLQASARAATATPDAPQPEKPSAKMLGVFDANKKPLLAPAFINGVTRYLRRYGPTLVEQNENRVIMSAKYDYQLNIELIIRKQEYEILVTVAQPKYTPARAQSICAKIATGVNKSFVNQLTRGTLLRDKPAPDESL